jgi:hypothetical protein
MAKLHHIRQLAVKTESTPGTAATGHAAGDLIRVRELSIEQNAQYFERPIHTTSWGYTPRRQENSWCEISFAVEIAGDTRNSSSWTAAPVWSRLLQACGMEEIELYETGDSGGTETAVIKHGEQIADNHTTPTEAATVVGTWDTGSTRVYHRAMDTGSNFTALSTITGEWGGGEIDVVSLVNGDERVGYAWAPDTDSTATVTLEFRQDNEAGTADRIIVYGARGDFTIDCQSQDIAVIRFTLQGIYSATDVSGGLLDEYAATAYREAIPPTFVDASLALTDMSGGTDDWAATNINFTNAQFTMGNNVVMRQNSNSTSGWLAAHIAQRTPNGSFNPDDPGAGTFDLRDLFAAETRWLLDMTWGTATYNTFRIQMPYIELDSVGDSERDEVQSFDLSFRATRGFDAGENANTVGRDNEFVLFYL